MSEDDGVFLNDVWTHYFHDPNNPDWTVGSYIRLNDISTVEDMWSSLHATKDKLKGGMFFIMRADTFPCWDDKSNINGGCISMKVLKENLEEFWEKLCIRLLGETLLVADHRGNWHVVNGISTSPKRYFSVVKVWLRTTEFNVKRYFMLPHRYYGDVIYRDSQDMIIKNNEKED